MINLEGFDILKQSKLTNTQSTGQSPTGNIQGWEFTYMILPLLKCMDWEFTDLTTFFTLHK